MLNLNLDQLLVETVYPGRRVGEPLLSVTKSSVTLNTLFCKQHIDVLFPKNSGTLYAQVIEEGGVRYLLLTDKKINNFYTVFLSNGCARIPARGFKELLGKKSKVIRYKVKLNKTNYPSIKAFELLPFIEDDTVSKELPEDFKIGS